MIKQGEHDFMGNKECFLYHSPVRSWAIYCFREPSQRRWHVGRNEFAKAINCPATNGEELLERICYKALIPPTDLSPVHSPIQNINIPINPPQKPATFGSLSVLPTVLSLPKS